MQEPAIFTNPEFGNIRTLETEDGKVLFCGADIANALGYSNPRKALADHCRCVTKRDAPHPQSSDKTIEMSFIPEGDVYRLIANSKLPDAVKFEAWVFDEVLPTIRKTGSYSVRDSYQIEDPIERAKRWIEEESERRQLTVQVSALTVDKAIMQPKADYFDQLVDRNLLTNLRDTAKELHIKQNAFVQFLLEKKYMFRNQKGKLMPYAKHIDTGLFEIKEFTNEKTGFSSNQALITPKGRETFRLLLLGS
ncbi:MAG: phage antirepressor KilAC domain-containing protein [Oscillospiraceae bacterium]|nr:phage antirepressor KilAC domain-containing protein [Oscillospiraceae bacterium]MBQ9905234.1 phage antirepressor KilAC domain-containing protein [Oscillospiraceae bacterium]